MRVNIILRYVGSVMLCVSAFMLVSAVISYMNIPESYPVQVIGSRFILYRKSKENPKIELKKVVK